MQIASSQTGQLSKMYMDKYAALREEARGVDQTDRDVKKEDGYVTFTDQLSLEDKGGVEHTKTRMVNSYPVTETKVTSNDPLISRTSINKKVAIEERISDNVKRAADGKSDSFSHRIEFVDDGRKLTVKDSTTFMGGEFFLSDMTQSYVIDKKTGAMKTLEPTASSF
jgi:hypothetical protein